MGIAKFISFCFFRFRFVSIFRNFFVFVSVNRIKIVLLMDISVSVNVNHTEILVYSVRICYDVKAAVNVMCFDFDCYCQYN